MEVIAGLVFLIIVVGFILVRIAEKQDEKFEKRKW